jgi:hypothetical protein
MSADPEPSVRFADVLTTASAVANYLGEPDVSIGHIAQAVAILLEEKTLDELGRPTSPLFRRPSPPGATSAARELVGRWFVEIGNDPNADLAGEKLGRFRSELAANAGD